MFRIAFVSIVKNPGRFGLIAGLSLLAGPGLTGCGKPKPDAEAEMAVIRAGQTLGESLNVRWVDATSDDLGSPSGEADLSAPRKVDRMTASGDQIAFQRPARLPGESENRFLVWSADWLGSQITCVSIDHRVEDLMGRSVGSANHLDAHFSTAHKRWYVGLRELVRNEVADLGADKRHLLALSIELASGLRKVINVQISLMPASPRLKITDLGVVHSVNGSADDRLGELRSRIRGGFAVASEQVTNLDPRPVKLWLFGDPESSLRIDARIARESWTQPGQLFFHPKTTAYDGRCNANTAADTNCWQIRSFPPTASVSDLKSVSSRVNVRSARVIHPGGRTETVELRKDGGVPVELAAGETAQVEWRAEDPQRSVGCELPGSVTQDFHWWSGKSNVINYDTQPPVRYYRLEAMVSQGRYTDRSYLEGYAIRGNWQGRLVATQAWEKPADTMDPGLRSEDTRSFELEAGAPGSPVEPYGCQALF